MDPRIFADEPMDLRADLLAVPLHSRLHLDPDGDRFFIDFEGLTVRSSTDIDNIRAAVVDALAGHESRVAAIVNYDSFSIIPELVDPYVAMVQTLMDEYYSEATRYTSNAFMRARLGEALQGHSVTPNLVANRELAEALLRGRRPTS